MRDYYAEFLASANNHDSSENELTKLTEALFEAKSDSYVSIVSSLSQELKKNDLVELDIQQQERMAIMTFDGGHSEADAEQICNGRSEVIGTALGKPYLKCGCGKHAFLGQLCPFCGEDWPGRVATE